MHNVWNFINQVGLMDAIDIAIVTFIIYKLLLLIRGTRAVQLLKGIFFILVMTGVSNLLNLHALKWLLDKTLTIGLLAIPVVFQPELRRALESLGRGQFFGGGSLLRAETSLDERDAVAEIARACSILSKNKIGALLVLERETGLSEYLESGVLVEGIVSQELLTNIFIPNTPLHDGAVMIRKNRLLAAGCFLPLSDNPALDKKLGTRHRAGVGISEQSDAIALIVSEETGQISVSIGGTLTRNFDEQSCREMLLSHLVSTKPTGFSFFGKKTGS